MYNIFYNFLYHTFEPVHPSIFSLLYSFPLGFSIEPSPDSAHLAIPQKQPPPGRSDTPSWSSNLFSNIVLSDLFRIRSYHSHTFLQYPPSHYYHHFPKSLRLPTNDKPISDIRPSPMADSNRSEHRSTIPSSPSQPTRQQPLHDLVNSGQHTSSRRFAPVNLLFLAPRLPRITSPTAR